MDRFLLGVFSECNQALSCYFPAKTFIGNILGKGQQSSNVFLTPHLFTAAFVVYRERATDHPIRYESTNREDAQQ